MGIPCKLCNNYFKTLQGLNFHVHSSHPSVTTEEYYTRYIGIRETCPYCGEPAKFKGITKGYFQTCGKKDCIQKLAHDVRSVGNLKKFGSTSPFNSEEVRKKSIQSYKERYGVDNPQKIEDVKKRTKETKIKKYGGKKRTYKKKNNITKNT